MSEKRTRREGLTDPSIAESLNAPQTPAGRWAAVDALLNPVYVETCPRCGSEVEKRGEPLIDRKAALDLLTGPGEDLEGLRVEELGEGQDGLAAWLPDGFDANGSPVQ